MLNLASMRPRTLAGRSMGAQARLLEAFTDAWETGVVTAERLRTGCIYEAVPANTYRILAMRFFPRDRRRFVDHAWRPDLAPSATLLGQYQRGELAWRAFAAQYLAQLDHAPVERVVQLLEWLGQLPARYPTVTFLCCEHAPGGDETRIRCHRRLLRAWLLGQQVPDVER